MNVRELSPELAKKAKEELFENPERTAHDIKAIQEWLVKQPHLHARSDDQWILSFLRVCKFSLERTKEKLDLHYTMKSLIPELTRSMDPKDPKAQVILNAGVLIRMTKTLKPDDMRVMIMRLGQCDPDKISIIDIIRVGQMMVSMQIKNDDQGVVAGACVIMDMANITMGHFKNLTPTTIKKMIMAGQDASPGRQKGSHYINMPSFAEKIFDIGKHFMNEKSKSRIFFHKTFEDLHKVVPKAILPTEYGGDDGPIQNMIDHMKETMEENRDWFLEDVQYKTDESKRPGKPKNSETLFGIEGSFRQLNID